MPNRYPLVLGDSNNIQELQNSDVLIANNAILGANTSIGNISSSELSCLDGVTSSIQTQLDAKAPLASPALTGTPTAPTATSGTNTTQIATTAFVKTEVANLIDAAPTALDTLNELAAALGDDANYATTVTTALSTKVAKVTSTDNAIVRFDGTVGAVQNSNVTIDDNGNLTANNIAISSSYPSIRPSLLLDFANTKRLDPRITFSRPTTATYYDGKTVVKAEENLLPYSQEFDNAAWSKQGTSITANSVSAPDGTNTADTLTADGTTNQHIIWYTPSSGGSLVRVLSIYAKAGTNNYFQLMFGTDVNAYANFDLSNGTVGTVGSSASASITSVGNGWYRCSIYTASTTASAAVYAVLVTSATASRYESNTLATRIYLWGAQLEQRSSVTAYTPTTSSPITNYVPVLQTASAGVARFDHDPVTDESKGLLIEQQRTNLLTYSEQFDNASWVKTAAANIQANQVVAPDGTLTGDKYFVSSEQALGANLVTQQVTTAGTTYTLSVYAKRGELNRATLNFRDAASGSNQCAITFSLVDGSVALAGAASGTFTFVGSSSTAVGNGWYRFSLTCTTVGTAVQGRFWASDSVAVNGDGYSGIYIWGAQLEAGSFATSYIPTTSAQVTRSADYGTMSVSGWYNYAEGSQYIESQNQYCASASHAGSGAAIYVSYRNNIFILNARRDGSWMPPGQVVVWSATGTAIIVNSGAIVNSNNNPDIYYKYAGCMGPSYLAVTMNGGPIGSYSSNFAQPVPTTLGLGIDVYSYSPFNGHIKKFAYYPKCLTNTELQTMTS